MAEPQEQVTLFENILAQPAAVQAVALQQLGDGRRDLLRAAEMLCGARRIVLTGMGASLFACVPLQYALAARGLDITVIEAAELLHFLEAQLTADTVVVMVSRSGESVELVKLLDILERRQCSTVGVVNVEGSSLDTRTKARLLLHSPADQMVAIQTYQATLVSLALLGAVCLGELETAAQEFESLQEAFASWVNHCVRASEEWTEFVGLTSPLYVLGRGSAMGTVAEGALLMHEAGKSPATGMSSAQFRHGPVEITDQGFRAVVIGTQTATSELDRALAEDLSAMGGQIRWIGPAYEGINVTPLSPWPANVPECFSSLFEVVPFQLLAYRTAESRGLVPGAFRWAPLVTNTETGFAGLSGS